VAGRVNQIQNITPSQLHGDGFNLMVMPRSRSNPAYPKIARASCAFSMGAGQFQQPVGKTLDLP